MKLYAAEKRWLYIPMSTNTGGTVTVSFEDGDTWLDVEVVSSTEVRILVAGPDAADTTGAEVIQLGVYRIFVRMVTSEEAFIDRLSEHLRVLAFP
jgi:hypothetical protein